jgi:hypothetical protein
MPNITGQIISITAIETNYESFKEEFFHLGLNRNPIEIED